MAQSINIEAYGKSIFLSICKLNDDIKKAFCEKDVEKYYL